jgi:hypothetical protein
MIYRNVAVNYLKENESEFKIFMDEDVDYE